MSENRSKYFITRFARFAPLEALPSRPITDDHSEQVLPIRNEWMVGYTYGLAFSDSQKEVLLYPVREIDVYIWSERKIGKKATKSFILDSNLKVQKKLISAGFLDYSLDIKHIFPLCNFIDIEKLSCFIPGSEVVSVDPTRGFILGHDIYYKRLGTVSHVLYVPCIFESKVLVELFLETSLFERGDFDELLCTPVNSGTKFQKIENNTWATPEVIEEIFRVVHL